MKIAVVGGGISGLAAALFALDRGAEVTLYEASGRLGGCLQTERDGDLLMERGPDSLIRMKPASIQLCERLGIDLVGTQEHDGPTAYVVRDGDLVPLPPGLQLLAPTDPGPFLRSNIVSWPAKLRMGMDLVLPRRKGASDDDDESLASFVSRRLGREALDRLAQPLISGVYSGDPERLSLRATMPRLLDLERKHRSLILGMRKAAAGRPSSGPRYSMFVTPESGMSTLVDALVESIELAGGTLKTDAAIESLADIDADGTILALPASRSAHLLGDGELSELLRSVRTHHSATVNFVWPRDAVPARSGNGFVVPSIEKRFIMAATFMSQKYPGRSDEAHAVVRAYIGGAHGPDVPSLTDNDLVEGARKDLSELIGVQAQPLRAVLSRWHARHPEYEVGHLDRVARIDALVVERSGIALAGNSYRGAGIAACVLSAQRAVTALVGAEPEPSA